MPKKKKKEKDVPLTAENEDVDLIDALEGEEREEFRALGSRVSLIRSHNEDPLVRDLENMSLSDEEKAVMDQYEALKRLGRERLNSDKI